MYTFYLRDKYIKLFLIYIGKYLEVKLYNKYEYDSFINKNFNYRKLKCNNIDNTVSIDRIDKASFKLMENENRNLIFPCNLKVLKIKISGCNIMLNKLKLIKKL